MTGGRRKGYNRRVKRSGLIVSLPLGLALGLTAFAADLPLPPLKPKPQHAVPAQEPNEFDRLAADCIEASNGCQRFVRASDGKFDALNNTGIACQPTALSCTKRK